MDQLKDTMLAMIQERYPMEPTPVPDDLQTIRLPLGFLTMRLDNWRAPKIRKVNVMRKKFPGYILVRLYLDDDSWYAVRNTPGVTGFVGSGAKPTPLSRREVERILGVRKDEEEKKEPRFKPAWEVGETVRVVEGPFADFNGVIEDINVDQSKVRVLVDIFGRETPVELNFDQILKF